MADYNDLLSRRKELETLLEQTTIPESMDLQQMLKGVRGDKLRDEKRRLYQQNQAARGQAQDRRQKILDRISRVDQQLKTADPERQSERFNRTIGAIGAGTIAGVGATALQESRLRRQGQQKLADSDALARNVRTIDPDAPDAQSRYRAAHRTARRKGFYSPRRGFGTLMPGLAMAGIGALGRFGIAPNVEEESARDALTDLGQATMTSGLTQLGGQYALNKSAGDVVSAESMQTFDEARERSKAAPAPPRNALEAAGPRRQPPAPVPTETTAQPAQNAERLRRAVRAAGGANAGKMTKAQASQWLQENMTAENRTAIARELNVNPGRNFATRLSGKIRDLASTTRRLPAILAPVAAGGLAYDAVTSPAEAGDGEVTNVDRAKGAAAGGVAAGTTAGAMYGMNKLARSGVGRAVGRLAPPLAALELGRMTADEMQNPSSELDDPVMGPQVDAALADVDAYQQRREMAQVPERNPYSDPRNLLNAQELQIPDDIPVDGGGQNALSAAEPMTQDEFGQALDQFLQLMMEEQQAQMGQQQQQQPPQQMGP